MNKLQAIKSKLLKKIFKLNLASQELSDSLDQLERLEKVLPILVTQETSDSRRQELEIYNKRKNEIADLINNPQIPIDIGNKNNLYLELRFKAKSLRTAMKDMQQNIDISLREINIKLGWQAIAYANSKKFIHREFIATLPGLELEVVNKILTEKINPMRFADLPSTVILRQILRVGDENLNDIKRTVNKVKAYHAGNCHEYSVLIMNYLYKCNIPLIELAYVSNGDHAFVIINRDPASDINEPEKWGPKAVICDGLANAVYSSVEINRLNWYHFTVSDARNPNQFYSYIGSDKTLSVYFNITTTYSIDLKNSIFINYKRKMDIVGKLLQQQTIKLILATLDANFISHFEQQIAAFKALEINNKGVSEHDLTRKADKIFKLLVNLIDKLTDEDNKNHIQRIMFEELLLTHGTVQDLSSFQENVDGAVGNFVYRYGSNFKFSTIKNLAQLKYKILRLIEDEKNNVGTYDGFYQLSLINPCWIKDTSIHFPYLLIELLELHDCSDIPEQSKMKLNEKFARSLAEQHPASLLSLPIFLKYAAENKNIYSIFRIAALMMIGWGTKQDDLDQLIDCRFVQSNLTSILISRWENEKPSKNIDPCNTFTPDDLICTVKKYIEYKSQSSPRMISCTLIDRKSVTHIFEMNEEDDDKYRMKLVTSYIAEHNDLLARSLQKVIHEKEEKALMRIYNL